MKTTNFKQQEVDILKQDFEVITNLVLEQSTYNMQDYGNLMLIRWNLGVLTDITKRLLELSNEN